MSHDSHDKFGKMDEANRAAIAEHDRVVAARQRPAARVMRWVAFAVGVLLCWLYWKLFATSVANNYDDWMHTERDLWFGLDHFILGAAIGIVMVVGGSFAFVAANKSHRIWVLVSSAVWMLVVFMPLCGAIVLLNQYVNR